MTGLALFNSDFKSTATSLVIPRLMIIDGTLCCTLIRSFNDETSILVLLFTTITFDEESPSISISGGDDSKSGLESHMTN